VRRERRRDVRTWLAVAAMRLLGHWLSATICAVFLSALLSPSVLGQECNTPPTWNATIWFPAINNSNAWPAYVGGQVTPWYVHFQWNAPCLGTITITSDYGQGPQTMLTYPLPSTTGTYDNGSPESGAPNPNGGFPSPPPVGQPTPWTITFTGTAGSGTSSGVGNATLLPLTGTLQFPNNVLVAASNATTPGEVVYNAIPSPTWFPSLSVQANSPQVSLSYTWPPPPPLGNETYVNASVTGSVSSPFLVMITSQLSSTNGVVVTASAN
jgi:hypothetical protein